MRIEEDVLRKLLTIMREQKTPESVPAKYRKGFQIGWFAADMFIEGVIAGLPESVASGNKSCANHKPVQHRDMKEPWCNACGMNAEGLPPRGGRPSVAPSNGTAAVDVKDGAK